MLAKSVKVTLTKRFGSNSRRLSRVRCVQVAVVVPPVVPNFRVSGVHRRVAIVAVGASVPEIFHPVAVPAFGAPWFS
jgi:hypothetical protein